VESIRFHRAGGGLERAFSDGGEPLHTTPLSLAGKTYTCKGRGGVSPEGQVARMPVDVRVNFFKFIKVFHRACPTRPQSKHVPSRESREKAWSQERGPSRPPHSQESFCMTNHACTWGEGQSGKCRIQSNKALASSLAEKPLHEKSTCAL
jgi:hypothetical protein